MSQRTASRKCKQLWRTKNGSDADTESHSPSTALNRHCWDLADPLDSDDLRSAIVPVLRLRESLLMGSWIRREDLILGLILLGLYLLWVFW